MVDVCDGVRVSPQADEYMMYGLERLLGDRSQPFANQLAPHCDVTGDAVEFDRHLPHEGGQLQQRCDEVGDAVAPAVAKIVPEARVRHCCKGAEDVEEEERVGELLAVSSSAALSGRRLR